jgi:hypothetical protein
MSDAELEAAKAELLQYKKEHIKPFMGWSSAEDADLLREIDAIDKQIDYIDQQLRIPPQDRSSVPRQSSPSPTLRHRRANAPPPRGAVVYVSKPIPYKPVFPSDFLEKRMKYIVVLACHGGV